MGMEWLVQGWGGGWDGDDVKTIAGIGVGMGMRVMGMVGDKYKYDLSCSSLLQMHFNIPIFFPLQLMTWAEFLYLSSETVRMVFVRWWETASVLAPLLPWCTCSGICDWLSLQWWRNGQNSHRAARSTCRPKSHWSAVSPACQLPRQEWRSNWTAGVVIMPRQWRRSLR